MAARQPPNFSWVDPQKLAGLACPSLPGHYQFLLDNGIQHLVCLCQALPQNYNSCPALEVHRIGIVDFTPPSPDQIRRFLSIVAEANSKGQGVGVHCMHGHGRTGTMLACYLVKEKKISADQAIAQIRKMRPGSIETRDQEKAVQEFQEESQPTV
ncbi:dual specificity protein phosphatase 23a [Denticeps clupeoides]|uniref:Dual specificity protein phosphatase 23 n=1 Tax=Denticeps clupeoides TaxID=299321 RepID=A0AAY4CFE7_9TELE|nr:dual specificity protein phosphatase 23 [Denticeps clupeoides]XP_028809200.1 dual specificity protein phosphatase 23 [Denticeps clupeoides]